ncbi:molybdate transport system ATP-binding protein [Pedococcus dokdonensis]|uniref:Molybdate transport system ATP-binding protein n=1 Tax=Pedococcus dokdonensis TaxID=443156 RepID=A0A1H0SRH6_9MICO|nr:ATP-binding cassette domain-containing protein [Pedococcus dokdonensis]SDP43816.1 molybdate transport system ATP-binding protein [Pedococcus dokdonensis]
MKLEARVGFPDRDVDLDLAVAAGRTLALLGPNGAGKSTLLASVAGLLRPAAGRITLDDRALYSHNGSDDASWVPPHARGVALLAQEARLFPHLSVLDNVAFGPRSAGMPRGRAREVAHDWLTQVDAGEFAERRPSALSGGQAQRVAIARALATEPHLLLLDEPLSALDVDSAPAIRQLLRRVLEGRTTILVTHDILDAVLLADDVAVLEAGRVVEQGPTARVLTRPTSRFAARIAGLNLVRGTAHGTTVTTSTGLHVEGLSDDPLPDGAAAVAVFSPSAVGVYRQAPAGSPRNVVHARVTELEPHGHQVRVHTAHLSADVTPAAVAELDLAPGAEVVLTVKASEVAVYAA